MTPFQKMLKFFEDAGFNQPGSSVFEFPVYSASLLTKWVLKEWDQENLQSEPIEDRLKIYSPSNPTQYIVFKQENGKCKLYGLSKELCNQIVQNWKMQFM